MTTPANPPWEISPHDLREALQRGEPITLLDCREPHERAICAIRPSDRFIPLAELPERLDELADVGEAPLIVYCHHGSRSLRAAKLLRRAGFPHAQSLAGGVDAWTRRIDPTLPRY
ncbi:MAG: rhodanese [Planctomycetota bacterium]|nr:MAG: rhodanese [Planctomycetota bacterium]